MMELQFDASDVDVDCPFRWSWVEKTHKLPLPDDWSCSCEYGVSPTVADVLAWLVEQVAS